MQPPLEPDTTSHVFRWQIDYIGEGLGSELFDVAILNDSLAFAVGDMYLNDSSGVLDPILYNYVQWDGKEWNVKRLYYHFQTDSAIGPISSIFAFNENDIWFGFGNLVHWDGRAFQSIEIPSGLFPSRANKIWGTSDRDLYVVGSNGLIVHFDGATWQALQTGSTLSVFDIWGARAPDTGFSEILAVASNGIDKKLFSIQGTNVASIQDSGLSASIDGVWFVPRQKYYVVGAGIGQKSNLDGSPWTVYPAGVVTSYMSGGVRGNGVNDVFVAGSFMEVAHFNGSSWFNYRNDIPYANAALGHISVKGNLVIIVGSSSTKAIAMIGRR